MKTKIEKVLYLIWIVSSMAILFVLTDWLAQTFMVGLHVDSRTADSLSLRFVIVFILVVLLLRFSLGEFIRIIKWEIEKIESLKEVEKKEE